MLEDFDRIYLINLARRPDRLEKWKRDNFDFIMEPSKFQIFQAVDGKQEDLGKWNFSEGAYGCLVSHLKILKDAKRKNYKSIIIFEDDFIFNANFLKELTTGMTELPQDWHMLYLYSSDFLPSVKYSSKLHRCVSTLSTVAYCVNSQIYDFLIELLELRTRQVDVAFGHVHFLINAYKFEKNLCQIYDNFSDIENVNTCYNSKKKKIIIRLLNYFERLF